MIISHWNASSDLIFHKSAVFQLTRPCLSETWSPSFWHQVLYSSYIDATRQHIEDKRCLYSPSCHKSHFLALSAAASCHAAFLRSCRLVNFPQRHLFRGMLTKHFEDVLLHLMQHSFLCFCDIFCNLSTVSDLFGGKSMVPYSWLYACPYFGDLHHIILEFW